jgi:hypothetical protein
MRRDVKTNGRGSNLMPKKVALTWHFLGVLSAFARIAFSLTNFLLAQGRQDS